MKHTDHIDHLLQDLLDGELDGETAARANRHLETCRRCRKEWTSLRALVADVQALPRSIDPPRDLWDEVEARLREDSTSEPARGSVRQAATAAPTAVGAAGSREPARKASHRRESRQPRRRRRAMWIGTSAAVFVAVAAIVWMLVRSGEGGWRVEALDGTPLISAERIGERSVLRPGEWLETDETSRARLSVGTIGEVAVEPNSRVQIRRSQIDDHRLALAHGRIDARIWAPPRLFFVETPSATAIDLGCAYTLDVDSTGRSILHVTSGYVELERDGKSSIVPAGAMCYASPEEGPGTVFSADAPAPLRSALERYDFEGARDEDLDIVLTEARPADALTLWQLVERSEGERRARIYGKLVDLVRPPTGVTTEGVLEGDEEMFEMWRLKLGLDAVGWWGYLREKLSY